MLEKIKSTYFLKITFSYLEEEQKLKIVKYNKNLQKVIDINLNNYKFFSGRYIINLPKGITKEYNDYNDELIFIVNI